MTRWPGAAASFFKAASTRKLNVPEAAKATDVAAIMVDGQWAHERQSADRLLGQRRPGA